MDASLLYKAGKLKDAIDAQIQAVKAHPTDEKKRMFLFELCLFAGDLERASRQIDAIAQGDQQVMLAAAANKRLLEGEIARRKLFKEGVEPSFLADPPEHARMRLQALAHLRAGRSGEARRMLDNAASVSPSVKGRRAGVAFENFRDADDLFGGILEVLAQGKYFWVPLEHVELLSVHKPARPRDLYWLPAQLSIGDKVGDVHLPAIYPGSNEHENDLIKFGRMTDWSLTDEGPVLGVGLRTFLIGEEAVPIMDCVDIEIGEGSAEASAT